MVLVYLHTSLPEPYANWRDYDADDITATLYFQSDRGDCSRSDGEIIVCKLSHVAARLLAQIEKGKSYRVICSHGRLVYKWSDLQAFVDTGRLKHRDVSGEYVSRNDGSSKKAYGPLLVMEDRPELALFDCLEPRCEVCLMGIVNLGIDWDRSPYRTEDTIECLESLHERYIHLCRKNRLGKHAITYAGQGNTVYQMTPGHAEIVQTTVPDVLNLEIQAYHGGRSQTFGYGHYRGECGYYDVSAFYPHLATIHKLPFMLHGYSRGVSVEALCENLEKYYCIAQVELAGHDDYYAFKSGFCQVFPTSSGTYYLHDCELRRAVALGHARTVPMLATYYADRVLAQPLTFLLSLRTAAENAGRKLESHYLKLIANGLIGRMGSRYSCWDDVDNVLPQARDAWWIESRLGSGEQIKMRSIGWRVQRCSGEYVPAKGSQAIAGAITALGRDWLWSLMQYTGRENVLAVNTDSLLTCDRGSERLARLARHAGWLPGCLRLVTAANSAIICRPGVYTIGDRHARQGYSLGAGDDRHVEGLGGAPQALRQDSDVEGGYDPENSPLKQSYSAVMARAANTPFHFFGPKPQGDSDAGKRTAGNDSED